MHSHNLIKFEVNNITKWCKEWEEYSSYIAYPDGRILRMEAPRSRWKIDNNPL